MDEMASEENLYATTDILLSSLKK